jgi:hypothetical protein
MSIRRRIVFAVVGIVALSVVLLAVVPLLFRSELEARVKAELANHVDARVEWSRVGVSLFRDFPNLTLRLDDLSVVGVGRFEGESLAAVPSFRMVLDLGSVLRSLRGSDAILLRDVELTRPAVRLLVLDDGTANWDIVREPDTSPRAAEPREAAARPFAVSLRRLEVVDGDLTLEDRHAGLTASVTGLGQLLSGDFRQARFTARSRTSSDGVSVRFAGVPYLSGVRLSVRADLDVDTDAGRITISDNEVRLNELLLAVTGSVGLAEDSVALDLAFAAPGTDFAHILSLVPAIYAKDFESVRTTGSMAVSGWVRGGYGATAFPALAMEARVENGTLRYPDLPLPARDIALELTLTNPGGDLDSTVVDLRRFHVTLGSDAVDGAFAMRTPVSDPDIRFQVNGRLDLADLGRTFKLEGIEELAGIVVADASMRARMSDLDARRYEAVTADGGMTVTGLVLRSLELPHPLRIDEAALRLSPRHAELASFHGGIGSTDLAMTGRLENLLGFALRDEELRGDARIVSRYVNLDEWRSDDDLEAILVPANIDFALQAAVDRITFGALEMRNARGGLRVKDQKVTLDDFRMDMLGGAVAVSGFYETTHPALPTFDVDMRMDRLHVPAAFAGLGTVRAFAPVARYAEGHVSAQLRLAGAVGQDMAPVHDVLGGHGAFQTAGIVLQEFPPLERLADMLKIPHLHNPGLTNLESTFEIRDGRLHVRPFQVGVGPLKLNVAGSNGIDQSLSYAIDLEAPRSALGAEADQVVTSLISQTSRAGLQLAASDVVRLGVQVSGTVTSPSLAADFRGVAGSAAGAVQQALREEAGRRVDGVVGGVEDRFDAAAEAARLAAEARRARLVAEAEARGETVRAEAQAMAERVRREGYEQADALVARASGPVARAAAQTAADRLRRETDQRADRIIREADTAAEALLAEARRRADEDPEARDTTDAAPAASPGDEPGSMPEDGPR